MKSKVLLSVLCLGYASLMKAPLAPREMAELRNLSASDRQARINQRPSLYMNATPEQRKMLGLQPATTSNISQPAAQPTMPQQPAQPTMPQQPAQQGSSAAALQNQIAQLQKQLQNEQNGHVATRQQLAKETADHAATQQQLANEQAAHQACKSSKAGLNIPANTSNEAIAGAAQIKINNSGVTPDMNAGQALLTSMNMKESHMLGRLGKAKKKKRGFSFFGRRNADA